MAMVRVDRFGNPTMLVACKPSRKNPDFLVGYVEIGKQLYKIEPAKSNKEGVGEWVKITKLRPRGSSSYPSGKNNYQIF